MSHSGPLPHRYESPMETMNPFFPMAAADLKLGGGGGVMGAPWPIEYHRRPIDVSLGP